MTERGWVDAAPGRRTAAGALLIGGYHPSKLWVGGLPDTATLADLEDCFGQIGPCTCTLKRGFGFVEYTDPAHAQEAVAKYHEGHFLGAQIKVELSLARAPSTGKGSEPPVPPYRSSVPPPSSSSNGTPGVNAGGCFVCGSHDHWARECPDSDKFPQRNPPGSDRPSDVRKPMWINGGEPRGPSGPPMDRPPMGRPPMDRPPMDRPPMDRAPLAHGPPAGYPPRYDPPPFDRPPYNPAPAPYGAPPPPVYGGRGPDPYYGRPPPRDSYPGYPPPPAPVAGGGYPVPPPFDRPPYSPAGRHPPPGASRVDPYADRYGPPPGRSPVMAPAHYDRGGPLPPHDGRPPYGGPIDPYARMGHPPVDGPLPGAYDPREERGGGGRYAPYPSRDDRGRPDGPYNGRSPRSERRRSLSPRRGGPYGGPPPSNGDYYSSRGPPPPGAGYGRPASPPRYPPPPMDNPYHRR
ncbi:uncharacterized protein JCM15063_005759 [Sporobolomyces koalae]|uniref:uncharacterized protein n=1 Tax=Sporobolomyces koalae TaxID=500713 RepID=UPI00316BEFEE